MLRLYEEGIKPFFFFVEKGLVCYAFVRPVPYNA